MHPELTLPELQRIYEQFAVSAYSDIDQSLYDSWSMAGQVIEDHFKHKAKTSIAYFDYDEDTYTLQTEAARLPEWFKFKPERFARGDLIAIYNPETGREVEFELTVTHTGLKERLVFRSVGPLRQTNDGSPNYLRVIITY